MNEPGALKVRPIARASDPMRLQRALAFSVMVLPILGTFVALYLIFHRGIGRVGSSAFSACIC